MVTHDFRLTVLGLEEGEISSSVGSLSEAKGVHVCL